MGESIGPFSALVVINPVVKTGVYVMSFAIGTLLLGPVPAEIIDAQLTVTEGRELLVRVLVGNVILAVGLALIGYILAFYGASTVRRYRA